MTSGEEDRQPTSAEILASIRRTIKNNPLEETPHFYSGSAGGMEIASEQDDFELPAMFRRSRDEHALAPSLVDRLSAVLEAIPPNERDNCARSDLGLSSLKSSASPTASTSHEPTGVQSSAPLPPLLTAREKHPSDTAQGSDRGADAFQDRERTPRGIPPCRDQLAIRMSTRVAPPPIEVVPTSPAVPKGTMGSFNFLLGEGSAFGNAGAVGQNEDHADVAPAPPPLSQAVRETQQPYSSLDADVAAALRPMLMQWMDDNINRVFAEALLHTLRRDRQP
jgi:cell pole-organizing protein PopZ